MVTSPPAIEDPAIPAGTDDPALAENPPEVSVEPVEQVEPLPPQPVPAEPVPQESAPQPSPVGVPLPAQPAIPAPAAAPVDEERRKEEERLAKLRQQDERNLRHAALHAEEHYKDFDFSDMPDRKAAMKMTTVESYISFHLGGRPLPGSRMERDLLRVEVALQRFHGRGAESEEAFHLEISKEAQHQEDRESLGRELMGQATRSVLISRFQPDMAGRYGWQQFQETARKHPAYSLADEGKLFPMWEAVVKEMDGHITPFAPQMGRVWEGMKRDAAAGVAASVYQEIAPKDRAAFMSGLGMLARSLPKDEQATFFGNLRKQAGRDIGTLLGNIAKMPASGDDLYGLGDFIGIGPTGAELRREWAGTRDRLLAARNFEMDVKRIEHEIYNPVKSAFGEGAPGIVESGVYAIPGALASTVLVAMPYVGLPALYSSLEASSYDTVRRQLLDSGMPDEAATYHAAQWAPYVALPQVALERLQAGAILGKLPFLEKAFAKFGGRITSDVVRGTLRVGIGAVQETSIEMAQGYIPYLLQDAASALSEDIPGVVWRNGKDGVLDGFWAQSASTLVTMLPLAILGAAGGVNADQRVKAFSNASDTTLLALGGSPEAIAALREAQGGGHASANAAIDQLFATLQPNGESAKQAAARLDAEQRGNADASSGGTTESSAPKPPEIKDITPVQRQEVEEAAYRHIDGTRIANTDDVRPLIPGYKEADPLTRDAEYHKIASTINHQTIDRLLAQEPNGEPVVILAGGAGSGKTTASGIGSGAVPMDFAIDTVMGWENAMGDLHRRVENSGRDVVFHYVYTPFEKALPRVIDRFLDKTADPRLVPLAAVVGGHIGAQQNIFNASDDFVIRIIDNSGEKGDRRFIDKQQLRKYDYLREQGREEAGFGEEGRPDRPNHDRQHQPSSGGKGTEGARERARARLLAEGREILKRYQREGKLTQREVDAFLQEGEFAPRKAEGE